VHTDDLGAVLMKKSSPCRADRIRSTRTKVREGKGLAQGGEGLPNRARSRERALSTARVCTGSKDRGQRSTARKRKRHNHASLFRPTRLLLPAFNGTG